MERFWFKAKTYGWGWTPATWQGWLIMLAYVAVITLAAFGLLRPRFGPAGVVGYVAMILVATVLLMVICYKTGESPRWRWGEDRENRLG